MELDRELAEVRKLVDSEIRNDVFPNTLEPEALRTAVRAYPERGGKRLRPAILLWSCGALEGRLSSAAGLAAAVEVFHNWTLVHDDIIDRDELRRGAPTCHAFLRDYARSRFGEHRADEYGRDFAILAGDVQQAWANSLVLRSAERGIAPAAVHAIALAMQDFLNRNLISGESLDVEFEFRTKRPSRAEVKRMIDGKTGELLSFSARAGALAGLGCGDWNHPAVKALDRFGRSLGYAFQLCDDLLGVFGSQEKFGKPICSDFREGKPTLLCIEAFERLDPAGAAELARMSSALEWTDSFTRKTRGLLESCGARQAVEAEAEKATSEALGALKTLPSSEYRGLLEGLAEKLLTRKY